jgi:hypothetical protein
MTTGIKAALLSLTDQELMLSEHFAAMESPDSVPDHQVRSHLIPPVNPNNESYPSALTSPVMLGVSQQM